MAFVGLAIQFEVWRVRKKMMSKQVKTEEEKQEEEEETGFMVWTAGSLGQRRNSGRI